MEMLNAYIRDLLFLHDCVIIPGFGGFVGNYQSARKTEKDYFTPPRKAIAFNPQLKQNDGLLGSTIVAIEKVSYGEATKRIELFVENLKKELKAKGNYTIPNVGKLGYSNENSLLFTPDATTNFLLSPVGLEAFQMSPLPTTQLEKTEAHIATAKDTSFTLPVLRRVLVAGVSGFALLSLLLNPGEFKNLTLSSIAPTMHQERVEIVSETPATINEIAPETTTYETEANREITQEINATPVIKKYHVIVGCFSMRENAELQKTKLVEQNINAVTFDYSNGLIGVSAGSFETFNDAKVLMDELRESGNAPTAWVLKKVLE